MREASLVKTRILDTAERLFGEHGFAATPIRVITTAAEVNTAAVHYYFHSKDNLIRAVYARRLGPVNERRLEMLDRCETLHGSGLLPLDEVTQAYLLPVIEMNTNGFRRLFSRMYSEPGALIPASVVNEIRRVEQRFASAFRRALPGRREVDLYWGAAFTIGMLVQAVQGAPSRGVSKESKEWWNSIEPEALARLMVAFAGAGLRSLETEQH